MRSSRRPISAFPWRSPPSSASAGTWWRSIARRFELATEGSVISLAELDGDLRFTWLHNPRPPFDRLVVGEVADGRLGPQIPAILDAGRAVLASGEPLRTEVTLQADDDAHSFELKITPTTILDGQPGLLVAAADVIDQKRQQAHLQLIMR